jgi:hypothetical protein
VLSTRPKRYYPFARMGRTSFELFLGLVNLTSPVDTNSRGLV